MVTDVLVFVDSVWHLVTIVLVFGFGVLLAIAQRGVFGVAQKRALFLYAWHTAFCIFYFWYSLSNVADSTNYYLFSISEDASLTFGTQGVYLLTSLFSVGLGMSYGGVFLVYNLFGYVGMLAFGSALQQVLKTSGRTARRLAFFCLLLPGLSFWSGSIGKDALAFMAAGLSVWAAMNLGRRYPAFVIASLCMLLVRPHMAGILLLAFAVALVFASRLGLLRKSVLTLIAVPLAVIAATYGAEFAGLGDVSTLGDVDEYFSLRQSYNLEGGSSVDIASLSMPARLFTFLFRPLFFDASGLLGVAVSFENLFQLLLMAIAIALRFLGRKSRLDGFSFWFCALFAAASLFVLANTTANLGIAMRQKWMFLPMLMMLAFSYLGKGKRP
ncbi:MAG: hypothetical protein A3D16_18355 [Rhodobacterales bacterium RIFCSPHIGHO2_02_FULL_62_130]|nr:MAG: hypothetical protein A3D16_18355 [Rhodobacterales bacterium RIFCSPHIGHO2_02_FULL_62_130]OHC53566.1 MAG: hypothetical protein A3E48_12195 [Rhodobacterales bacterium RIFCSPHIGHO2_12_FULL_62_75]HCZ00129.1 hypothetical protein [Rhodobacter sp.]